MVVFELIVVALLIVFNGLLSMSEMAIVSSRRALLKAMADRGDRGAQQALTLSEDPGRFLSTVQIGITLVGVLAGAFSGATLAEKLAGPLRDLGIGARVAENLAFVLVVAAITYLSLICGELVPKQAALRAPERIAAAVSRPLGALARVATPLVVLLDLSTRFVLLLLGRASDESRHVTEEEIRVMVAEAESHGVVNSGERRMISNVMRLGDLSVQAIMTPRMEMEWVDITADDATILDAVRKSPRSRLVACEENTDNVVGVLVTRDVLQDRLDGGKGSLRALVREPVLLPATLSVLETFDRLHAAQDQFGLVIDEYGHVEGIVSLADAVRAIRGQSAADAQEQKEIVARDDGSFLIDGSLAVEALEETLGLHLAEDREYHTVAGLLLHKMRRVPNVGQHVVVDGWRLEVVDMDGRRVDKVLAARTG